METLECIKSRRSIRKFLDIPVEIEKLGKILEAGQFSPSAGNIQDWRFIIVTDENVRQELGKACVEQYWAGSAPLVIVVCANPEKAKQFYHDMGEKFSMQNAAAAIQSMLLAAHDQGLGSSWVGAFEDELVKRLLDIPDEVDVHAILPIGYADEHVPAPKRFNLEELTYQGKWGNKIADIAAYMEWYGEHVQKAAKKAKKLVQGFARRLQQ